MKFMVINKPTGHGHGLEDTPESIRKYAGQVQELMDNGTIEEAYVIISGGHLYIIDADTTEELVTKVRYNPLFKGSHTEVIAIEDALGYLEGYAAHLEKED